MIIDPHRNRDGSSACRRHKPDFSTTAAQNRAAETADNPFLVSDGKAMYLSRKILQQAYDLHAIVAAKYQPIGVGRKMPAL